MKLSTEGSVGDRCQVSQATEIATTVPEAIVSIGPSIPVNAIEEKVVTAVSYTHLTLPTKA